MNSAVVLPFLERHIPKPLRPLHAKPAPFEIREQMVLILQSTGFVRAARMRRFLEFIVEETLDGRAHQLCEYSIATSVFGRGEAFESGLDPIVRNDARRLRQKLLEYYDQTPHSPVVIEVPKGTYVPLFRSTFEPRTSAQYRLSITLTRVSDGAEIWSAQHEY